MNYKAICKNEIRFLFSWFQTVFDFFALKDLVKITATDTAYKAKELEVKHSSVISTDALSRRRQ
ncbi:hypothetical protein EBB07_17120 [Paenibacillaceae bacterium]|nr:hypothetical protein EBB07_17120 [Paenibacillaceae bacterium]